MAQPDKRSGEDRRDSAVTHETLYNKQLEHDSDISEIKKDVHELRGDVHEIGSKLEPIATGIQSMVFLFKMLLALGAVAAAGVGIIELWESLQHVNDHVHGG